MASYSDPQKPAPAPMRPRALRADKPERDKSKTAQPKVDSKEAPVVFSDWASI